MRSEEKERSDEREREWRGGAKRRCYCRCFHRCRRRTCASLLSKFPPVRMIYIPPDDFAFCNRTHRGGKSSHPRGFFARRVRLDVISQTTRSPREMAISVERYLALLVLHISLLLLQYRKYWPLDIRDTEFFLRSFSWKQVRFPLLFALSFCKNGFQSRDN